MSVSLKRVLLLRMADGDHIVCDEYYPTDSGRVHVLGDSYFAEFDLVGFTLEHKKSSRDVAGIVYSQESWPSPIAGSKDRAAILSHFGIPDV